MKGSTPISIVSYEEDANLREVTWNQRFLDGVKSDNALKHRQAVLYVNAAKDRFRLVVCFYGLAVLVLPPTDKEARLSIYLIVSQFLRRFSSDFRGADKLLAAEEERAVARINRRKKLANKARRRK